MTASHAVIPVPPDAPPCSFDLHGHKPTVLHTYRTAEGEVAYHVARYQMDGAKEIRPWTFRSHGQWEMLGPEQRLLYNLDRITTNALATVIVTEGEKSADAAPKAFPRAIITTSGSASSADSVDWTPVAGMKLLVFGQPDKPGRKYVADVIERARKAGVIAISEVDLAEVAKAHGAPLKHDWDVADLVAAGRDAEWFAKLLAKPGTIVEHDATSPTDKPPLITATPYIPRDPATIPPRQWVYGIHLIRGFLSIDGASGGIGKTNHGVLDALSLVTGRDLAGSLVHGGPKRVWSWNLEDPRVEIERRIAAAMKFHGITHADIEDRLFLDSGRDNGLCIAETTRDGTTIIRPVVDALVDEMLRRRIDVLHIDPFVSSHHVPENDTGGMDLVAKEWGRVADRTNSAIKLVHHVRKPNGSEVDTDSLRGAKAITDAARSVRFFNPMTEDEAERAGLETHLQHYRLTNGKANLAPRPESSEWFEIRGVLLANGDNVGVAVPWKWPNPFDDVTVRDLEAVIAKVGREPRYRESCQAKEWVGRVVADVLGVDLDHKGSQSQVKGLLRVWIANRALRVVPGRDERRKPTKFVVAGDAPAVEDEGCSTSQGGAEQGGAPERCSTAPPAPPPLGVGAVERSRAGTCSTSMGSNLEQLEDQYRNAKLPRSKHGKRFVDEVLVEVAPATANRGQRLAAAPSPAEDAFADVHLDGDELAG